MAVYYQFTSCWVSILGSSSRHRRRNNIRDTCGGRRLSSAAKMSEHLWQTAEAQPARHRRRRMEWSSNLSIWWSAWNSTAETSSSAVVWSGSQCPVHAVSNQWGRQLLQAHWNDRAAADWGKHQSTAVPGTSNHHMAASNTSSDTSCEFLLLLE
jgi:hypothetical protein